MKKKQPLKETFQRIGGKLNEFDRTSQDPGDAGYSDDEIPFDVFMGNLINSIDNEQLLLYLTNEIEILLDKSDLYDLKAELRLHFDTAPDGTTI